MQKIVATRIPVEFEEEILRFMSEEGLDKSAAIRRILETDVGEWKRRILLPLLVVVALVDLSEHFIRGQTITSSWWKICRES